MKLFQSATQGLYKESSDQFDCDPEELLGFLTLVEAHNKILGYHSIFQIPASGLGHCPIRRDSPQTLWCSFAWTSISTHVHLCEWAYQDCSGLSPTLLLEIALLIRKIQYKHLGLRLHSGWTIGWITFAHGHYPGIHIDTQATAAYSHQQQSSLDE